VHRLASFQFPVPVPSSQPLHPHLPATRRLAARGTRRSPSELNAPTVASKRSVSFFFLRPKLAFLCPFRRLMPGGLCQSIAALEAKHHHHPQLAQRWRISISTPPVPCAPFRACHQLRLLLLLRFYCSPHELSNNQQMPRGSVSTGHRVRVSLAQNRYLRTKIHLLGPPKKTIYSNTPNPPHAPGVLEGGAANGGARVREFRNSQGGT
jgi:hypothetical protein